LEELFFFLVQLPLKTLVQWKMAMLEISQPKPRPCCHSKNHLMVSSKDPNTTAFMVLENMPRGPYKYRFYNDTFWANYIS